MEDQVLRAEEPSLEGAGFWIRAFARIIDIAFGYITGITAGVIAVLVLTSIEAGGQIEPGWQQRMQGFSLAGFAVSFSGSILNHTLCEGIHGASLGKLMCRLRVTSEEGSGSSLLGAFVRSCAFYLDSLYFGDIAHEEMKRSKLRQRFDDRWG